LVELIEASVGNDEARNGIGIALCTSAAASASVSGRVDLSGFTNWVSTRKLFSALRASAQRTWRPAGLSLALTTAKGNAVGAGVLAVHAEDLPEEVDHHEGDEEGDGNGGLAAEEVGEIFPQENENGVHLEEVFLGGALLAEAAGEVEEEGLEGGALAGEEAAGEGRGTRRGRTTRESFECRARGRKRWERHRRWTSSPSGASCVAKAAVAGLAGKRISSSKGSFVSSSSSVPRAWSLPWSMMPMREHSRVASSM